MKTTAGARRGAAVLIACGAALRLLWIARPSLWSDEASTLMLAGLPLRELLRRLPALEATPPLHFLLARLWLLALPAGPTALRLLSWTCGAAALWLFWRLARALFPERAAWALAAAALCSSWVHASQDGRCYALLLALSLASALIAWRLRETRTSPRERSSGRDAAEYAILAGCGVLTHHFFAFSVAADALFLAFLGRRGDRRLQAAAFIGPGAAIAAVARQAVLHGAAMREASLITEGMTPRHALEILGQLLADPWYFGLALTGALALLGALALAAVLASAPALWRRGRSAAAFCWLHLALPFALARAAEAVVGTPLSQARYLIAASPFLLLLLVEACASLPWKTARAAAGAAAAAVLAAGLGGYLYCAARVDPHLDRLAAAIRAGSPPSEPVVHLNPFYYLPLRFYYLPERTHLLVKRGERTYLVPALPGYDGVLPREALGALGSCAVVDPDGSLFARKLGRATGRQLADALR